MSEGWIKLTSEFEEGFVSTYREFAGAHQFGVGFVEDGEIRGVLTKSLLSTTELANIPWVRALVESNRQLREQIDQFHEADKLAVMEPELGDYCSVILDSEELAQAEALANVALKPFEDVIYG